MNRRTIIASLLILASQAVMSQNKQQLEEFYKDANSYFYFEDYEEALALYLKVYPKFENNHNLSYKIGICYLNIAGHRHKSIPYLEFAAQNISKRFNEFSTKETRSPIDVLFYLANAYFINNQLDKAQKTYEQFHGMIRESQYNMTYYNHQINTIKSSKIIQSYPVNFLRSNLGEKINDRFSNFNAVISGDGKTMAFTSKRQFYQAIHICRLQEDNTWSDPQNITLDLVVDGNCSSLSLSFDGTELYLYKDDNHDGNIYMSHFENDEKWTPMKKLNENINTNYYETHASVSADGRQLYFTSNRAGGYGDQDIYVTEREPGGDWGPAKNLGPNINTDFNENTPFVSTNNALFFSSEAHNNMGGYDVFFSQLQNDKTWSKPINLGYPINTTDDDLFYFPMNDGSYGLVSLFDSDGYGEMDIYQIEIFLPRYQRSIITTNDLYTRSTELPKKTLIIDTLNSPGIALLDPSKPNHLQYIDTDKKIKLFFEGKGYSLRDQEKIAQILRPKVQQQIKDESIKIDQPTYAKADETSTTNDSLAIKDTGVFTIENPQPSNAEMPGKTSKADEPSSNISMEAKPYEPREIEQKAKEVDYITDLLIALADDNIKPLIKNAITRSWQVPPTLLMLQTHRLANAADSLGLTNQFIDIFTKLIDIVNLNAREQKRQYRQISSSTPDEAFFFNLQHVKKDASPGLAQLIDNAIISDQNINSFVSLWKYLSKNGGAEIKPYLSELVTLLAKHSIDGYFNLSEEQKEAVYSSISSKHACSKLWCVGGASLIVVILILFIYFRRRRSKSSNQ